MDIVSAGFSSKAKLVCKLTQGISRLLARDERVLGRLRVEIESVLGSDTSVSKAKLQQMPYLKCIMTESE